MNVSNRTITTLSSREFNQDAARAKRAAEEGPVFITTRGEPSQVLMSIEEYRRLEERPKPKSLAEAIEQKDGGDFDFKSPKFKLFLKAVEFD
jgi:PHD/YefM family antitoxin component YafN of YafNO toxin-antitoxin module